MALIEVDGLTRSFRTWKKEPGLRGALKGLIARQYEESFAVRDISFRIEEGEFVGFLGPNGAGKTTTLKMLAGLLHPTRGSARVLGFTPWERKDGYRRQFALLLGQKNQLWWDLPARDSLELNAKIYGIAPSVFVKTVDDLAALLQIGDKLGTPVRELSLGERMKCELIAALLHQPRVLFLDEPTIGLDVVSARVVRDFLRQHNRLRRTTILLTSHYMADIQALCERVIIIDRGIISFDGRLAAILDRFADFKIVTLHLDPAAVREAIDPTPFGEVLVHDATTLKLKVKRERVIPVCKGLLDGFPVLDFAVEDVPIEEVIRQVFQHSQGPNP